ncbi:MAG: RluA family pseudouridine synthase [Oscillospiraceae bacterium]|nr:RluA family pseudouridine synthase [Oscillospiraceae bacterium]
MQELTISPNDAGQRLDRFLAKAIPALPGPLAQKYIRLKRIKVNGKRAEQNYRLLEGDTIQLYIGDEFFEVSREELPRKTQDPGLNICYEDEQILIVNKPPGLLCHSGDGPYEANLVDQVKAYLQHTGAWNPAQELSFVPALCNRLDRNTGGLVLAAKTAAALQILNQKIRDREVDKYYLLAVHGRPNPPTGRIEGHLVKDSAQNRMSVVAVGTEDAKDAVTVYRTLETRENLSLVECLLETGRTHQIRAQMAALGCPLLGDRKYGGLAKTEPHQALWAYRVTFSFTSDAGVLDYLHNRTFFSGDVPFLGKYFTFSLPKRPKKGV